MTFNVNHIGMNHGIYLARKDARVIDSKAQEYLAVTYDIRLRKPYQDVLLTLNELHTLEHLLSEALRQSSYPDFTPDSKVQIIYEGAMACQTGMYFIFFGPEEIVTNPDYIGSHIAAAADYALHMTKVPAKEQARCGNFYSLLEVEDVKPILEVLKNLGLNVYVRGFDQYSLLD